jgi:hypothetical protein
MSSISTLPNKIGDILATTVIPQLPTSKPTGSIDIKVKSSIPMPALEPDPSTFSAQFRQNPQLAAAYFNQQNQSSSSSRIPILRPIVQPSNQPVQPQNIPILNRIESQQPSTQVPLNSTQSSQMYSTNARLVPCNNRNDKLYCGSKCYLPDSSYTRFGTPHECLMKGIGVGKRQRQ